MVSPLKAPPFPSAAANVPEMTPLASETTWKRVSIFVVPSDHISSTPFVTPPTVNVALPVALPFAE